MNLKNIKGFSSFTLSYLLKVTKFLVKISQFEFLVMTEQEFLFINFLSLNIPDFSLFLLKNCNHPLLKNVTPSFSATPSKNWGSVKSPPLFENLLGGSISPSWKGGGCTLCAHCLVKTLHSSYMWKQWYSFSRIYVAFVSAIMKLRKKCIRKVRLYLWSLCEYCHTWLH